jgi:phosphoglycerol transferase MdoB-like AlkP superfamily enzyme
MSLVITEVIDFLFTHIREGEGSDILVFYGCILVTIFVFLFFSFLPNALILVRTHFETKQQFLFLFRATIIMIQLLFLLIFFFHRLTHTETIKKKENKYGRK